MITIKKLWMPLLLAVFLLTACIPQDAGNTPQPTGQQTPEATATPTATPSPVITATPTVAPTAAPTASATAPAYWPAQVPENIPVFNYGTHVETTVNGGEVTMVFSGVSKADYADYRDTLAGAGYFLADEVIEPVGVSEFTMNGTNSVVWLRVTKDDFAQWKYTPAG